jgi:hypothetical protein
MTRPQPSSSDELPLSQQDRRELRDRARVVQVVLWVGVGACIVLGIWVLSEALSK